MAISWSAQIINFIISEVHLIQIFSLKAKKISKFIINWITIRLYSINRGCQIRYIVTVYKTVVLIKIKIQIKLIKYMYLFYCGCTILLHVSILIDNKEVVSK